MTHILYIPKNPKRPRIFLKKALYLLGAVFVLIFVAGGLVFLLRMPFFKISEIELSGFSYLTSGELENKIREELGGNYFFILPKNSFFLLNSAALETTIISSFPRVRHLVVNKKYPNKIMISLTERSVWGIICEKSTEETAKHCVYVDTSGFSLEEAPLTFGSLITKVAADFGVGPWRQLISSSTAHSMQNIRNTLLDKHNIEVIGYELSEKLPGEIRVLTSDGFKIFFLGKEPLEKSMQILGSLLEGEIKEKKDMLDYIDLRFGNKVFYKYK